MCPPTLLQVRAYLGVALATRFATAFGACTAGPSPVRAAATAAAARGARGLEVLSPKIGPYRVRMVASAPASEAATGECELFYWREKNREVDFVVRSGRRLLRSR
jgi:hypothetical protein